MRWQQRKDRNGIPVPECWVTDSDYVVARVTIGTVKRFIVTAPGQRKPFLYADSRDEVIQGIKEHRQEMAA